MDKAAVENRIATGETCQQKAWQFIRGLNASEERLDAVAFRDGKHKITYRQFFCEQDRYAEVFSGLGIAEVAGSRVGVVGTKSVDCIVAFFALNMLGVSVSFILPEDLMLSKKLLKTIEIESITDLVLPDTATRPDTLQKIMRKRKKLALRNVIVVRTSKRTPCPTKKTKRRFKQNLAALLDIKGVLYMKDLLHTYQATPIAYGSGKNDEAAVIVHTSGTTKSIHKPVSLSDVAVNTAAMRILSDERFLPLRRNAVCMWADSPAVSVGLIDEVYCPLAFGAIVRVEHGIMDVKLSMDDFTNIDKQKVTVLNCWPSLIDFLDKDPKGNKVDFSKVEMVIFDGFAVSLDQVRHAWEFMHERGGNPRIVVGYGLLECGATKVAATYDDGIFDEDHGIGQPLAGVSVLVKDEQTGEVFAPDGQEHTGILYLSSESNSSGRIGDTVFFEPEVIDGKSYVCTNDLVRIAESGDIFLLGRANRFFVNNDGIPFDAGVVAAAIGDQKGIAECAIVPAYDKLLMQDTVPVLYVRVEKSGAKGNDVTVVRRALRNAYVNNKAVAGNNLPWQCVIAKRLPHNDSGKVDRTRIQVENTSGRTYLVVGVEQDDELVDVRLVKTKGKSSNVMPSPTGVPKKLRKDKLAAKKAVIKTCSPDYLPQLMAAFGSQAMDSEMGDGDTKSKEQKSPLGGKSLPFPKLPCFELGKRDEDVDEEERGGLNVPEPINTIMRLGFHASDVAYYYED